MCQGEFTFSYHVIDCLRKANIKVVAACSERIVSEVVETDGLARKVFTSKFIRFREYM